MGSERFSRSRCVNVKRVVHDNGARPNAVQQLVFGDELASRLDQNFNYLEGSPANRRYRSKDPQLAAGKVDLAIARRVNRSIARSEHGNARLKISSGLFRKSGHCVNPVSRAVH
jgi:hypothetical protein